MKEFDKYDNQAIRWMNRFNDHAPLVGRFFFAVAEQAAVTFTPADKGKRIMADGEGLKEAVEAIKGRIDPMKIDGEGDEFIGQRHVAKLLLAEK